MESKGKIKIEGDITPVKETVKEAEEMLDKLEEERQEAERKAKQTAREISSTFRHMYNMIGNFIQVVAGQAIPPIADALIQSLVVIVETYQMASATMMTNPASAYLGVALAATAIVLNMTAVTMAQLGMGEVRSRLDAAASMFRQAGGFLD